MSRLWFPRSQSGPSRVRCVQCVHSRVWRVWCARMWCGSGWVWEWVGQQTQSRRHKPPSNREENSTAPLSTASCFWSLFACLPGCLVARERKMPAHPPLRPGQRRIAHFLSRCWLFSVLCNLALHKMLSKLTLKKPARGQNETAEG